MHFHVFEAMCMGNEWRYLISDSVATAGGEKSDVLGREIWSKFTCGRSCKKFCVGGRTAWNALTV